MARSKACAGVSISELGERGKTENELRARQIGRERGGRAGRFPRLIALAEHQPKLAEPAHARGSSGCCSTAASKVSRAASMRKSACWAYDKAILRRRRGAQLDGTLGIRERLLAFVLHHVDDRPQGVGETGLGVPLERAVDVGAGLVHPPDGEQQGRAIEVEVRVPIRRSGDPLKRLDRRRRHRPGPPHSNAFLYSRGFARRDTTGLSTEGGQTRGG